MRFDLLVCGAAGQGVITLSKVITRAAVTEGFEAQSVAYFGIAKTEGPVVAHVRVGNPMGPSPKIRKGRANLILAMDRLEALRHSSYLKSGELVLIDETGAPPITSYFGATGYPSKAGVEEVFQDMVLRWIPATILAKKLGSAKLSGAVMLGAFAAMEQTIDRDHLVMSLRTERPEFADQEAEAFFTGFAFITGKDV